MMLFRATICIPASFRRLFLPPINRKLDAVGSEERSLMESISNHVGAWGSNPQRLFDLVEPEN
jgi:hypothetical protein